MKERLEADANCLRKSTKIINFSHINEDCVVDGQYSDVSKILYLASEGKFWLTSLRILSVSLAAADTTFCAACRLRSETESELYQSCTCWCTKQRKK